jgi:hypothetical protein
VLDGSRDPAGGGAVVAGKIIRRPAATPEGGEAQAVGKVLEPRIFAERLHFGIRRA